MVLTQLYKGNVGSTGGIIASVGNVVVASCLPVYEANGMQVTVYKQSA